MFNALSSKVAFDNLEDSLSGTVNVYPTLANAITVTSSSSAWTHGSYAEIVPVDTISDAIFVDSVVVEVPSAAGTYQIDLATGAAASEVVVSTVRFAAGHASNHMSLVIPIRKKVLKNVRISARCASKVASAKTLDVSISYRTIS